MFVMGTVYLKLNRMSHDHLYNLTPLTIIIHTIINPDKVMSTLFVGAAHCTSAPSLQYVPYFR